ncbi:hypothetical protein AB205_0004060 [Aquarana catesbeiana]|uniref:Uncharacterized protein n=1 Tax=Aquarana catesbeiana TaxID=8400 RepID=A0A2G9QKW1_AQUCT|nr:hypothetical protein AB205_0004060 [Aquarana catesbeiana]
MGQVCTGCECTEYNSGYYVEEECGRQDGGHNTLERKVKGMTTGKMCTRPLKTLHSLLK